MYTVKKVLFFFIYSSLLLALGLLGFGVGQLHIISVTSLCLTIVIFYFFFNHREDKERLAGVNANIFNLLVKPFSIIDNIAATNLNKLVALTLLLNLIAGIVNVFLVSNKLNETSNLLGLVSSITIFTMVITQIGGWFLQATLIYMLAYIFNAEGSFQKYLIVTGVGYIGFMIVSFLLLPINFIFISDNATLSEFSSLAQESFLHAFLGKIGEYWTLMIIAAGIYTLEQRFTLFKSIAIACAPSILFLVFKELFAIKL